MISTETGREFESLLAHHPAYPRLYDYQKFGAQWLTGKKYALLADDMGLGKSSQAIIATDLKKFDRILVLCPAVARLNWKREFEMWSNRPFPLGNNQMVRAATNSTFEFMPGCRVHIYSYDTYTRNPSRIPKDHRFDLIITDESHFLKNPKARRTKAVYGKSGLIHQADRVWALTGTPMPNGNPDEMWTMLYTFGVTPLKYTEFVSRYCITYDSGFGLKVCGMKENMSEELRNMLDKIMLRRRKEDVLKSLPPIYQTQTFVEPGPVDLETSFDFAHMILPDGKLDAIKDQYQKQKKLVEDLFSVAPHQTGNLIGDVLKAISPAISTLQRINGMKKVEAVGQMVEDELMANAYPKIVLFCRHSDVIRLLDERLKKFGSRTIWGGTSADNRQRHIDNFQNQPHHRVIIIQIIAGGTAITLTAANQILMVEPDWVPANNAQAIARCHRIGQLHTVFVRYVALANSIDEKISKTLERKTRDVLKVFNTTPESALTENPEDENEGLKKDPNAGRLLKKFEEIKRRAEEMRLKNPPPPRKIYDSEI